MLTRVMSEVHSRRSTRTGATTNRGALGFGDLIFAKLLDRSFHAPVRRLPADAHLYSWGDSGDWLYLVQSGWVKSMTWSWGGKPCLLEINGPSALLGVSGFLTRQRAETAMTKTTTEIRVIARDQFQQITGDPSLHDAWQRYLTEHIVEQQESLTHFVTLDSEHRLAVTLLRLGRKVGVRNGAALSIGCRITHDELAQMVGTTRSRVGYFLKGFESAGLVCRSPQSIVVDETRMVDYLLARL